MPLWFETTQQSHWNCNRAERQSSARLIRCACIICQDNRRWRRRATVRRLTDDAQKEPRRPFPSLRMDYLTTTVFKNPCRVVACKHWHLSAAKGRKGAGMGCRQQLATMTHEEAFFCSVVLFRQNDRRQDRRWIKKRFSFKKRSFRIKKKWIKKKTTILYG